MHLETVLSQLKSMRLSAMATALEIRLKANDHAGLSHEEFIALLVHDEWEVHENGKLTRMISRANFKPEQACQENIRYDDSRGFTKPKIVEFRKDTWIRNARNLIITGATGSGKTFIAEAIALQACRLGFPSMKKRYRMILEEVRESKAWERI